MIKKRKAFDYGRKSQLSSISKIIKPVQISFDLAQFIGCREDEKKSPIDVAKILCNYINSHNLQNPSNKCEIYPDEPLLKLIDYRQHGPIRYNEFQDILIKKHF